MGKLNRLIDTDVYSYKNIFLHGYVSGSVSSSTLTRTVSITFDTSAYYSFIPRILYVFAYKNNKSINITLHKISYKIGEKTSLTSNNFLSGNIISNNTSYPISSNQSSACTVYKFYSNIKRADTNVDISSGSLNKFPAMSNTIEFLLGRDDSNFNYTSMWPAVEYLKLDFNLQGSSSATGTSYINAYIMCDTQRKFNK